MSSFRDRFGNLTVEQARELNEAAHWFCEHEVEVSGEVSGTTINVKNFNKEKDETAK